MEHVCGFAGPAMFSTRVDFDFLEDNIPDWMHNLARVFLMLIAVICGTLGNSYRAKAWAGMDRRHRAECELFGIFPEVWLGRKEKLPDDVRAALLRPTDAEIDTAYRAALERMLRAVGESPNGMLVNDLRARVVQIRTRLRQPGDFFYTPSQLNPLPWRLTPTAFDQVDSRIHNMSFPHNTEPVISSEGDTMIWVRVIAC